MGMAPIIQYGSPYCHIRRWGRIHKVTASIGAMATSLFMWLMFAIGWFCRSGNDQYNTVSVYPSQYCGNIIHDGR